MTPWNLFLDDERFPPDDGREWVICRSTSQALSEIAARGGWPAFISFDHDLGGDDTAMGFIKAVIDELLDSAIPAPPLPFKWAVHSANPIGATNIKELLFSYEKVFGARR